MTVTLPATPCPDWGYEFQETPRIVLNSYGDGYSQRIEDGLNHMLRQTTITYSNLSTTEFTTMRNFFRSLNGIDSFKWRPEGDVFECVWYASKISQIATNGSRWTLTVDIKEDPTPI